MKIKVRFEIEGIHRWSDCLIEEVSYLKDFHRHRFGIIATKLIVHDNRDIEFIQLQHQIKKYLYEKYWSSYHQLHCFDNMSCEAIARELILRFNLFDCEVNEDNENGAILDAADAGPNVWIVCGRICSGKSTTCNQLIQNFSSHQIVSVGNLVREMTKTIERTYDQHLDIDLSKILEEKIYTNRNLIIDGIRQKSILQKMIDVCEMYDLTYQLLWIETSKEERKKRYEERADIKDKCSFVEYEQLEDRLGIEEVKFLINYKNK